MALHCQAIMKSMIRCCGDFCHPLRYPCSNNSDCGNRQKIKKYETFIRVRYYVTRPRYEQDQWLQISIKYDVHALMLTAHSSNPAPSKLSLVHSFRSTPVEQPSETHEPYKQDTCPVEGRSCDFGLNGPKRPEECPARVDQSRTVDG